MTHAYQEIYLSNAQAMLGDAFDYGINACHSPGSSFVKLFVASTVSKRLENGEPSYLSGKSGIEVARDILAETTGKVPDAPPQEHFGRSREYWIGWAVAYYQWFSGRSYSDIFQVVTFEELQRMYDPLHDADSHCLRLHTGRAGQAILCQSALHPDVRTAQQGYQQSQRRDASATFKGARLHHGSLDGKVR